MNDSKSLLDQSNLDDLEKVFYTSLSEQNSLKGKLKETQLQLQEMTLSKLEIERILESQRRELSNLKAQCELMQQWRQDNNSTGEASIMHKIQLESLVNEKNALSENIKTLQFENMNLKAKVESTEKHLKNQKELEKIIETNKLSMNFAFENIYGQTRKLTAEHKSLCEMGELSKNIGEYLTQLLKQHHKVLNETFAENEELKKIQNLQSSELNLLKQESHALKSKSADNEDRLESRMQKLVTTITSLTNQIEIESDEKKNLGELLKKTLNEQITNFETEQNLRTRIIELEKIISCTGPNEAISHSLVYKSTQTEEWNDGTNVQ